MEKLKLKFSSLQPLMDENNHLAKLCSNEILLFGNNSVPVKFENPAHCFDMLVSWSYALIYEVSGKNFEFLFNQAKRLKIEFSKYANGIKKSIHALRTYSQHSLSEVRYKEMSDYRMGWFQDVCQENEPSSVESWIICIKLILDTLAEILTKFIIAIREILSSEHKQLVITEWERIIKRNFSQHEYEMIVEDVLKNLHLYGKIEPLIYTKKYITEWKREIDILPDGVDFRREAYSLIEKSVLQNDVIPVNGEDLINAGIEKGTRLGKCIAEAKRLFYADPCTKEQLIERVIAFNAKLQ